MNSKHNTIIICSVILLVFAISTTSMAFAQLGPGDTHIGTPSPAKTQTTPNTPTGDPRGPTSPDDMGGGPGDTLPWPPSPLQPKPMFLFPPMSECELGNCDPTYCPYPDCKKQKQGGKDPIVIGEWWYHESDCMEAKPTIDFNNDTNLDSMCYITVGEILVVDFGIDSDNDGITDVQEGIIKGENMLQFSKTTYENYTPIGFMKTFPNVCDVMDCYKWNGTSLKEYDFKISDVDVFEDGKLTKTHSQTDKERYVYCEGQTSNGESFHCIKPTFYGYP